MDIRPPKNYRRPTMPVAAPQPTQPAITPDPVAVMPSGELPGIELSGLQKTPRKRRVWLVVALSLVGLALLIVGGLSWYLFALQPRDSTTSPQPVMVEQGMTPRSIANLLEDKRIIRSAVAFELYTMLGGYAGSLQAGSYQLSAAQSVPDIVEELLGGRDDVVNVIVVPGMTLKKLADPTVKNSLAAQGFSQTEIEEAFNATYDSPVLADRPVGESLEGYIFPDTYQIRRQDGLKSLVTRALNELHGHLQSEGMLAKFTAHGLTLHEAITLASLVQLEVTPAADQKQVAQVFLSRLAINMSLGSDVTFVYAANQAGVTPTADFDSPYNTRLYPGLPPGPISNMGLSALQAVANPASGDYLYFVSGDDGVTHFTHTYEEHQIATATYCQTLCKKY